ncbi:hypothetical protein MRX96_010105 [Rhipicephalus microplus]
MLVPPPSQDRANAGKRASQLCCKGYFKTSVCEKQVGAAALSRPREGWKAGEPAMVQRILQGRPGFPRTLGGSTGCRTWTLVTVPAGL